ncbi:MAG: YceI family protein [Phycisphaerae bacterium]
MFNYVAAMIGVCWILPGVVVSGDAPEELIAFVQRDAGPVSASFEAESMPRIQAIATAQGVPVRIVDVGKGAPADLKITPVLMYQNHKGRSYFQGRFKAYKRFENFLRVARRVPQDSKPLSREKINVWKNDNILITAHIKVAPMSGTQPKGYDEARFQRDMRAVIQQALQRFAEVRNVSLTRMDREFYMDFYPWGAEDGTIYLSTKLFSQFHCKKPVFVSPGDEIAGPWSKRDSLFRKAAKTLEQAVVDHFGDTKWGDGFEVVGGDVPRLDWKALGLALPAKPRLTNGQQSGDSSLTMKDRWSFSRTSGNVAARGGYFLFQFPAPYDSYSGRVKEVWGELAIDKGESWNTSTIQFSAAPSTVTMGDVDLDHMIHEEWLTTSKYPEATFVADSIVPDEASAKLSLGELTLVTMKGRFSMIGVSVPVIVRAQLEPVINDKGGIALAFRGGFDLPLAPFKLEGPDEEDPAGNTLVFTFDLTLY